MRRVEAGVVRPGWEAEIEAQGLVYNRTTTPGGEVRDVRAALCRCGQSGHKPYCDGTHAKVGWTSGEG